MERHKSTTHQEMFFHIFFDSDEQARLRETARGYKGATVFCRKEGDYWYASVALCAPSDQFSRSAGRSQARRKYFNNWRSYCGKEKLTYDDAKRLTIRRVTAH